MSDIHKLVIIGGGAAGLELATKLGRTLGKKNQLEVTLIDPKPTHIWKPLLHEVAAGIIDSNEEVSYLAQARRNNFRFRLGYVDHIDREHKQVRVKASRNGNGEEIIPERTFSYDTLVISVGSVCNSFGISGVDENCLFLDSATQAKDFQRQLVEHFARTHSQTDRSSDQPLLSIAIVGAGATGVELAAALHEVTRQFSDFGLDGINPEKDVKLTIIEAANRVLPALPEKLAAATSKQLNKIGVEIKTDRRVVEVSDKGLSTHDGEFIPANIKVWAAGIKAPEWLSQIEGLETNRINQLVVRQTLQTSRDDNIFAMGDCAACQWNENTFVPPRAQAAHQQAEVLYKAIVQRLKNKPLPEFHYQDYGSLIALGDEATFGNLMGNLLGSVSVGGKLARTFYLSLYKMHQRALFGTFHTMLLTVGMWFRNRATPSIKLH